MSICRIHEIDRDRAEVEYGEIAFAKGKDMKDCPYKIGCSKRTYWMTGFLDARTRHNLRHVFEPNLMSFP